MTTHCPCKGSFPGQPCAVRERGLVLNASWPLSRTAGEGGERSETGEGFAAFQILSRHSARGALVVSPVVRERGFATAKSVAPPPHCIAGERVGPGQSTAPWMHAFAGMTIMPDYGR